MNNPADYPPGVDCAGEIADAFYKFLETASTLTGLPLFDHKKPKEGGLIGVCVLNYSPYGHTSNWSNIPPEAQQILLAHHLGSSRVVHGHAEVREPN